MITVTINARFEDKKDLIVKMLHLSGIRLNQDYEIAFDDIPELSVDDSENKLVSNAMTFALHTALRHIETLSACGVTDAEILTGFMNSEPF